MAAMATCCKCGMEKERSLFSRRQWKKGQSERICVLCTETGEDMKLQTASVAAPGTEAANNSEQRRDLLKVLVRTPEFDPVKDPRSFHGRMACARQLELQEPKITWDSNEQRRADGSELDPHDPQELTARMYTDTPEVLAMKVKMLAELLLYSKRTVAYTGAGISVAAGIGMAAVGPECVGPEKDIDADPTLAHYVMAELNRQGLLHGWVQQNHDGLPQKAGYRQEDINEIHGAWFDPSNPVVITEGGFLRGDLYKDFSDQMQKADLVMVVGTTLAGHNCDSCVKDISRRSMQGSKPPSLGSVIINPQKTMDDGRATLRIFAKADDVMQALAKEFAFGPRATRGERSSSIVALSKEARALSHSQKKRKELRREVLEKLRVLVPYDKDGVLSRSKKTYLNLSVGSKVRISTNNNLEGALQHEEDITCETVGTVHSLDLKTCSLNIVFPGLWSGNSWELLGLWWLETAQRGGTTYLPVVNVDPEEVVV